VNFLRDRASTKAASTVTARTARRHGQRDAGLRARPAVGLRDSGYAAFKSANASRQPVLYVGANDGFLHAFNADTGKERGLTRPPQCSQHAQAGGEQLRKHLYFVDGTPEVMDVYDGGAGAHLVAGLGAGARHYALDVTNPSAPAPGSSVTTPACVRGPMPISASRTATRSSPSAHPTGDGW
jgi:type IV pilus assembly protein PilY1